MGKQDMSAEVASISQDYLGRRRSGREKEERHSMVGTAAGAGRLHPSCTSQASATAPDRMEGWPKGHHGSIKPEERIKVARSTVLQARLSSCGFIL